MGNGGWEDNMIQIRGEAQLRRSRGVIGECTRKGIRSTTHGVRNGLSSSTVHAAGARNSRTLQNPRPALGGDKRHALMEEALSLLVLLELIALVGNRRQEAKGIRGVSAVLIKGDGVEQVASHSAGRSIPRMKGLGEGCARPVHRLTQLRNGTGPRGRSLERPPRSSQHPLGIGSLLNGAVPPLLLGGLVRKLRPPMVEGQIKSKLRAIDQLHGSIQAEDQRLVLDALDDGERPPRRSAAALSAATVSTLLSRVQSLGSMWADPSLRWSFR